MVEKQRTSLAGGIDDTEDVELAAQRVTRRAERRGGLAGLEADGRGGGEGDERGEGGDELHFEESDCLTVMTDGEVLKEWNAELMLLIVCLT